MMVRCKVIPSTRIGTKYLLSLDILDEFLKSAEDVPTVPEAPPIGGIRKINVAL